WVAGTADHLSRGVDRVGAAAVAAAEGSQVMHARALVQERPLVLGAPARRLIPHAAPRPTHHLAGVVDTPRLAVGATAQGAEIVHPTVIVKKGVVALGA